MRRLAPLCSPAEQERSSPTCAIAHLDGLGELDALCPRRRRSTRSSSTPVARSGSTVTARCSTSARSTPTSVDLLIERVLAPLGRRVDRTVADRRRPPRRRRQGLRGAPADRRRRTGAVDPAVPPTDPPTRSRSPATSVIDLLHELLHARCNVVIVAARRRRARRRSSPRSWLGGRPVRAPRGGRGHRRAAARHPHAVRLEARPATHRRPRRRRPGTARAHGAAAPTGSHRGRRGARRRGVGARPGDEHRPRRIDVDVSRQRADRRPAPARVAGAPGGADLAAGGDPPPARPFDRRRRSTSNGAADGPAGSPRSPRSSPPSPPTTTASRPRHSLAGDVEARRATRQRWRHSERRRR